MLLAPVPVEAVLLRTSGLLTSALMQGADSGRLMPLDSSAAFTLAPLEACQQGGCGAPRMECSGLELSEVHTSGTRELSASRRHGESMPCCDVDREAMTELKHLRKALPGMAGCPRVRPRGASVAFASGGHQSSVGTCPEVKGRRTGEPRRYGCLKAEDSCSMLRDPAKGSKTTIEPPCPRIFSRTGSARGATP